MSMIEELRKQHLCQHLSEEQLETLCKMAKFQIVERAEVIAEENSSPDFFYIIIKGGIEITKTTTDEDGDLQTQTIATLGADQMLGEISLLDNKPRSATATALGASVLIKFDNKKIQEDMALFNALSKSMAIDLSDRLRYTNDVTLKTMLKKLTISTEKTRIGIFIILTLWLLALYTLSIAVVHKIQPNMQTTFSTSYVLISLIAVGLFFYIKQTTQSLSDFGFKLDNWKKQCLIATLCSLPIILYLLILKGLYLLTNGQGAMNSLLSASSNFLNGSGAVSYSSVVLTLIALLIAIPLQEFIIRGCLQSSLTRFLPENSRLHNANAIVLPNLILALTLAYSSVAFALASLIPGITLGIIYHKQKSLFTVCIAHLIMAGTALFIIGFPAHYLVYPHL